MPREARPGSSRTGKPRGLPRNPSGAGVWCHGMSGSRRVPLPLILVGRGTSAESPKRDICTKRYAMLSRSGLPVTTGTTSSRLPFEKHVNHTTPFRQLGKSAPWSGGTARAVSSSGRSYTSIELCMCTDYSRPPSGQMPFWNVLSGQAFSAPSEDPRCVQCGHVRPYRLTSVSM